MPFSYFTIQQHSTTQSTKFLKIPQNSAKISKIPQHSAKFRKIPQVSINFRNISAIFPQQFRKLWISGYVFLFLEFLVSVSEFSYSAFSYYVPWVYTGQMSCFGGPGGPQNHPGGVSGGGSPPETLPEAFWEAAELSKWCQIVPN